MGYHASTMQWLRGVGKWIHDPEGRDDLTLVLLRKL